MLFVGGGFDLFGEAFGVILLLLLLIFLEGLVPLEVGGVLKVFSGVVTMLLDRLMKVFQE